MATKTTFAWVQTVSGALVDLIKHTAVLLPQLALGKAAFKIPA